MDKKFFGMPVLVLCLLVCFLVMCNPFVMVGPGERGIKIRLGEVEPESYGEGCRYSTDGSQGRRRCLCQQFPDAVSGRSSGPTCASAGMH